MHTTVVCLRVVAAPQERCRLCDAHHMMAQCERDQQLIHRAIMRTISCSISKSIVLRLTDEESGKTRKHHFIIPDHLVEIIDGHYFLKLSRKYTVTRRIMTMFLPSQKLRTAMNQHAIILRKCDVPQKIYTCLDQKMRTIVAGSSARAKELPLQWSKIRQSKKYRHAMMTMSAYVDVQSPSIGDIEPVTLTLVACTTSKVVSMKVTDAAITWLGRAVAHQLSHIESPNIDEHQGHIDEHQSHSDQTQEIRVCTL